MLLIPSLDGPNRRLQAQVRHILDQIWNVLFANLGCAVIYVLVSWGSVDPFRLMLWLSALLLLVGARAAYLVALKYRGPNYIELHAESIMRVLALSITLSAVLWGLTGSALLYSPDPFSIMVSTFIIAGLSGGAVASYAVSPKLLYTFLMFMVGPLILRLASEPQTQYKFLAALAGLYLILLSVAARNVSRHNRESIDLSLANQDLIRKFNDAGHEVRTPVAAIVGFAEALKERADLPPIDRDFANIIYRNSVYLGRLVDSLFLMAKAEAGELPTQEETFNLSENIHLAVELIRKKAEQKGLRVLLHFQEGLPAFVTTCPIKLQQILINLLSNAVKFTHKGEIRLSVDRREDNRLRVRVADTGIGVREDGQNLVFAPFWRENRREVKIEEGSGLGLALSRHLVVLLGGDLRLISSRVGEGSVFELTLPVTWSEAHEGLGRGSTLKSRLNGKRILFADDSADLRSLFSYRFTQAGAMVETAEDGPTAIAKIEAATEKTEKPDVIILDLQMPNLDGYKTAATLRQKGVKAPILALTASADSSMEKEKCRLAGFNAVLSKSMPVTKVVDIVAEYV